MSGARGAAYEVVSAEELERRALVAARDRLSRLQSEKSLLDGQLRALGLRAAQVRAPSAAANSSEVAAAAQRVEEEIAVSRRRLDEAQVAKALSVLRSVKVTAPSVPSAPAQESPSPGLGRASESDGVAGTLSRAMRLVQETADSCGADVVEELQGPLGQVLASSTARQASLALDVLRLRARELRDAHRLRLSRERERELAMRALDGCRGPEAAMLRRLLAKWTPESPLPVNVGAAADVAAKERHAEDDHFVAAALTEVLGELGYEIGEAPLVATPRGGRLLALEDHPRHAIRVRAQDGRLLMNVTRLPPAGEPDPPSDQAAEVDACPLYDAVEQGLLSRGVGLKVFRRDNPGQAPVAAARSSDGLVTRAKQRARQTKSQRPAQKPRLRERPLP